MKIIESRPVPMGVAKEIMLSKNSEELTYEQKLAVEHLSKFTKLEKEKAEKLFEELSQITKLSPQIIVQIVDILPQTADELRVILAAEKISLKEDEMKKILETVKKYL